jgi:hypothetical protein
MAWEELQRPALHREVIRPLFRFEPIDPPQFPERWPVGATLHFRGYLFGIIPIGTHTIFIERIDPATREIQSREVGGLVRRWDHLICVRTTGEGQTLYSDAIIIEAGWLTLFVWLFAQWFYRHRQRRWRRVARRLVAVEPTVAPDGAGDRGSSDA